MLYAKKKRVHIYANKPRLRKSSKWYELELPVSSGQHPLTALRSKLDQLHLSLWLWRIIMGSVMSNFKRRNLIDYNVSIVANLAP